MNVYPDWKIKLALRLSRAKSSSTIKEVDKLITALNSTDTSDPVVRLVHECYDIYKDNKLVKEVLEACFLCADYSLKAIESTLGIPTDVAETYQYLCFDLSVFKYKILKYEYVSSYKNDDFPDGKLYKQWALSLGMDFIRWKFDPINYQGVAKRMLGSLMGDSFYRAKEHIHSSITSDVAKESLKWIKSAKDLATDVIVSQNREGTSALNEFALSLRYNEIEHTSRDTIDIEIVEG
jgi:hypothetical protein